jgi:hypothetical protein
MEHGLSQFGCVHALPGRLRVRVPAIKKAPEVAARVEQTLRQEEAVVNVAASPVTGSVLVHYDPAQICASSLLAHLEPYGLSADASSSSSLSDLSNQLSRAVGRELVKLALTQIAPVGPVEVLCALI